MTDTTAGTPEADAEAEAPAPPDPEREALADALRADLGDGFLDYANERGDLTVRVDRSCWRRAAETLRTKHAFEYFCFLSGIDWLENPELSSRHEQVWDPAAGDGTGAADGGGEATGSATYVTGRVAGGETRFQVFARLYNTQRKIGITLKADLDDANPTVESWVPVFRGADWHEREAWEMFGFTFDGHPGLRHIYLPGEFEGFPLRKDFPLLSRVVKPWPGLVDKEPVPGEDDEEDAGAAAEGGAGA